MTAASTGRGWLGVAAEFSGSGPRLTSHTIFALEWRMGYLIHDPLDLTDPALDFRSTDDIPRFLDAIRDMAETTGLGDLVPQAEETAIRARILLGRRLD